MQDTSTSCSIAFGAAEHPLRSAGKIKDYKIGFCPAQAMYGQDVIEIIGRMLKVSPDILRCSNPDCFSCHKGSGGAEHF
jgi:hypothetical protein